MNGTPLRPQSELPSELSSFVGRRHELAEVRAALARARLVTLSGPGGVGKTRLALRAAADLAAGYRDGVRLVELAPIQDPGLVADTAVASLGIRGATAAPPGEALVEHLRDRALLLVLDNCEHVRGPVTELVGQVLDGCPQVRVLATSRHALLAPQEHLVTVPPLPVPPPRTEASSPESLLVYDAVRLFHDRATSVWPSFAVTADNQGALVELLRRLDGVPLAIELAAVRVRSLSVHQILERLGDRFSLLSRGDPAAMPRQHSLRALIDWSHALLTTEERLLWERSSIFAGGFDATDLAAVVCDEDLPAHLLDAFVDSLVTKSILIREETSPGPRFRQLESIKEYGRARLAEAGLLDDLRDRHLAHMRGTAEAAGRQLFGSSGVAWFHRLLAEHDDLRAALERCAAEGGPAADGAEIVAALQHYWVMSGRFAEGRHWARRLLARIPQQGPPAAALRVVAGRLAVLQGDVVEGRSLLQQGRAEAAALADTTWQGHALHGLALTALFWEDPAAAQAMFEEALARHRTGQDPFGVPLALIQLATLHAAFGESARATAYAEECIDVCDAVGDKWCAAMARWTQALGAWHEGRTDAVRAHAREVLLLKEPFGDRLGMAMCMELIAWSMAGDGRDGAAARLLGAAASALNSVGGGLFRTLQDGHDLCLAQTRAALGEARFDGLMAEGAALPFDEAVALALGRSPSACARGPSGARAGKLLQLTRREAEAAHLVADGLTDREIAQRMVLARRTAEGHVQRALRKLGFTSRQQLAGWVLHQRGE